jgi:hypothetical protein
VRELLRQLPPIRRAREYHLYDVRGRRYLDLWQEGGRCLLGHRPGRLVPVLKAALSKGLLAELPSVYSGRLQAVLARMFPAYRAFYLLPEEAAALQLAAHQLGRPIPGRVADPVLAGSAPEQALVRRWRPLQLPPPTSAPAAEAEVLLPVLPFGLGPAPVVACLLRDPVPGLPAPAPLSPLLLAGALRSLHDLARLRLPGWLEPDLLAGAPGWRQRGIYVVAGFEERRYPEVFGAFLEAGVLLSPTYPGPSILPCGELSGGELQKMVGLFRRFPGE